MSAHEDDAGYDLYASAPVSIPPWSKALIPTQLAIQGPPGTYATIADRSGLALKYSLPIDGSYCGNVEVIPYNGSSMLYEVQQGDKVSPFMLERFSKPPTVLLDELPSSARGISNFGSSGNSVQDTTKAGSNHITILNHQESQHTHPSPLVSDIKCFLNENESLQTKMADHIGYASELCYGDVLPLLLQACTALVLKLAAVERFLSNSPSLDLEAYPTNPPTEVRPPQYWYRSWSRHIAINRSFLETKTLQRTEILPPWNRPARDRIHPSFHFPRRALNGKPCVFPPLLDMGVQKFRLWCMNRIRLQHRERGRTRQTIQGDEWFRILTSRPRHLRDWAQRSTPLF